MDINTTTGRNYSGSVRTTTPAPSTPFCSTPGSSFVGSDGAANRAACATATATPQQSTVKDQLTSILEKTKPTSIKACNPVNLRYGFGVDDEPVDPDAVREASKMANDVRDRYDFVRTLREAVLKNHGSDLHRADANDYDTVRILYVKEQAVANANRKYEEGINVGHQRSLDTTYFPGVGSRARIQSLIDETVRQMMSLQRA